MKDNMESKGLDDLRYFSRMNTKEKVQWWDYMEKERKKNIILGILITLFLLSFFLFKFI